jgi:hypothetical protein
MSCEVDPRGVHIDWAAIAPEDVEFFVVERYDGQGSHERLETEERTYLDTDIVPGEEYFYVVRGREASRRPGEDIYACVATASVDVPVRTEDRWVTLQGCTEHTAYLEVSVEQDGRVYSRSFIHRPYERIGRPDHIDGVWVDFRTPYVLLDIVWDATRFVTSWEDDRPVCREVSTRAAHLGLDGRSITLWLRDGSTRELEPE